MKILIFANAYYSVSGGDKIFTNFAKNWVLSGDKISIVTNEKGAAFCRKEGVKNNCITIWNASKFDELSVILAQSFKCIISSFQSLVFDPSKYNLVFASSFFFPDLLPSVISKLKVRNLKLVVGFYSFIPPPWTSGYQGNFFNGILTYFNQSIAIFIIKFLNGVVLTASQHSKKKLAKFINPKKIMVIGGGVNLELIKSVSPQKIMFDAVYVGRFHPQKNIAELIDIWAKLNESTHDLTSGVSTLNRTSSVVGKPTTSQSLFYRDKNYQLAMIGEGPLKNSLMKKINRLKLKKRVKLLGFLDGRSKIKILKSSRVFVSCSHFDNGNLALDEALTAGIPAVIYDLPGLENKLGVVKVKAFDTQDFTRQIKLLLSDNSKLQVLSKQTKFLGKQLSWKNKAIRCRMFLKDQIMNKL